ncbi:uncharacterized protein LOC112506642 isoform X1 [Cynara cardunculus var. scolymus]|uniref:uncharacterized protein LOC112506642 isoform X1 n=1 Tax=Cynara cardunculus var. scolymus TaxID=59895 RepID=UPI000D62C834|nr:uncharacterized protein LOC112506642 isoform X1 [Cynara cardunculus var. scolymus]XP_024966599.1 uncharacterized protein LOC112506642 isoform X1 [Cynara cardunculus var. scolymus]XP_024966600.1 uncharacterized protein LOC112506642 isoform X1 [Cynara cardunculus var. scolymus]XP_024966601.1 uncharacterized protein LOC112506642 isoform X1 [Cynara cardunculus var. scolymus]XP_024966602.1 uncharacterized protein LOC112506642 isoform X1 [Cynara cardunculus var. scolymus]XP_024966603.1 uncharacte
MGSACCVAARDRTITDQSVSDVMPRNDRYSPSWSFRWDNRGRVAGEESSMNCFPDGAGVNDRLDNKSHTTVETAYATEQGSPLDSSRSLAWQKSPPSEENGVPQSDPSNSKNLPEGKESRRTPVASELCPTKILTPTHSVSSFSASPLSSSQGHLLPLTSLTPSRWPRRSPGHHLLRQVSDSRIRGIMSPNFSISEEGSPFMHPGWSSKSNRGSHGGSSDGWSIPAFPDLATTSNRDRWSFDSDSLSFSRDRISRSSGRVSSSPSIDMQICGVCSKLLTEKSAWRGQKGIVANGYPIVAVLICGHVYHAECLESMTPEIHKYDPACPICTFGEKKVLKLSEKALATDMDLKAKISKKLRNRVVDGDSVVFKSSVSRMSSSSSVKCSTGHGKPFLRRHFSFGSKWNRSLSDNSCRKKRFFWSKE